jgi:non-homologous end joining protein Ku
VLLRWYDNRRRYPAAEVIDLVAALRASVEAAKKRREDVERAEMKGEDSSEPDE